MAMSQRQNVGELHLKLESIKKDIEDELEDNTSQKK